MRGRRFALVAARSGFVLFFLMTSGYCLLAYVPFAYVQFVRQNLIPWLTLFARLHPYLYWVAAALAVLTLTADVRRRPTRLPSLGFIAVSALAGPCLAFHPILAGIQNDSMSAVLGLAALAPIVWVAGIDLLGHGRGVAWSAAGAGEDRRIFRSAIGSAIFLSLLYTGIFHWRFIRPGGAPFSRSQQALAVLSSLFLHLLAFIAAFVVLNLVRGLASLSAKPARAEFWLCATLCGTLIALVLRRIVFDAISFTGAFADVFAGAVGISLALSLAGIALRLRGQESDPVKSGIALLLSPLALRRMASWRKRALWAVGIALAAYGLAVETAVMDWNYLLQKLAVLALWALTFAGFYAINSRAQEKRNITVILLLVAALSFGAYRTLGAQGGRVAGLLNIAGPDADAALDRYAGYDGSYRVLHDLLAPRARVEGSFYEFLQRHTNISRDRRIDPVDVNLVSDLVRSPGEKPNVFIFVIDSLRRDYLSPYNPSVGFTASIGRFARDSVVFTNAFTHYGATGLSEPSIWVGGLLVHKQYVTPFYPMNTLQKLLKIEDYQPFISMDSILRTIVEPSPSIVELDEGLQDKDYGFCASLLSLREKMEATRLPNRPTFAYTQPQDIHISVITRERASVPPGEAYPGFYAPYASRIKRMDSCFGEFIRYLKDRGLYEKSVVILASDHGDSLGEDGRWGHAYTLFPEIIRIPLIIHLPAPLRERLFSDPSAVAFSTDITPTLYYLLGHKPSLRGELFGRPLFTETREEQLAYRQDEYLLASSYGPVYGMLSHGGRSLYIVDGINYVDYFLDLTDDPMGERNRVTAPLRAQYAERIRQAILAIDRFYQVGDLM